MWYFALKFVGATKEYYARLKYAAVWLDQIKTPEKSPFLWFQTHVPPLWAYSFAIILLIAILCSLDKFKIKTILVAVMKIIKIIFLFFLLFSLLPLEAFCDDHHDALGHNHCVMSCHAGCIQALIPAADAQINLSSKEMFSHLSASQPSYKSPFIASLIRPPIVLS